ncbi:C40 family peptidase [Streptomyces erythrochromogenes]|uniref:C40 family peptidase n=1 Tax=Streptomyces erythrochromogenes TaxID=285574 RepID=UPI00342C470B
MPPHSHLQTPRSGRAGPARHRKPSRRPSASVVNLGIATGIAGTVVAAGPAGAVESLPRAVDSTTTTTLSMPLVQTDLVSAADTAETLSGLALRFELEDRETRAEADAAVRAKSSKTAAERQVAREKAAKAAKVAEAAKAAKAAEAAKAAKAAKAAEAAAAKKRQAATAGKSTSVPYAAAPAGSSAAQKAVAYARSKVGSPYVYGAVGNGAFDCSGLVVAAYKNAGINLGSKLRTSGAQAKYLTKVTGALQPGDILYWTNGTRDQAYHVAIYIGGGKYIGAQNSRIGVVERSVAGSGYAGAVRV